MALDTTQKAGAYLLPCLFYDDDPARRALPTPTFIHRAPIPATCAASNLTEFNSNPGRWPLAPFTARPGSHCCCATGVCATLLRRDIAML
jgi:hypothetical protein